ncbi:MAG: RrF2 family transcriptional regulator [Gemmatimonas sp.]|jgi:Rrf2 family protein|uniref:RrF2 family transcriptional regulator n=1 Tax=Gemmatimonas sp. TaxID=1962908 RepID=UPI0022CC8CAE|nr:Rrf2 family transcriptional regulator [Gemmatimonas sp.]MCZ8011911.1 Rrf2 family transcriptional regulator [Gemmatimonas sp.]MCZ8267229.1 Rrf2 family transcriptional regulator [Gemmatimonas sp.]
MLSATAEHAVRAVLLLARHNGAKALSADAIAAELGAPRNYLAKTLNALAKAGVVRSARGAAGGFTLAIAPETLTLARIINPFDDHARTPACLLRNRPCDSLNPCAVHGRWNAIVGHAAARFEQTTIAELLVDAGPAGAYTPAVALPVDVAGPVRPVAMLRV